MRVIGRVGSRAVELGLVTEKQVVDALKFQKLAKIENGLDLGIGETLLWQGAIDVEGLARLQRETGNQEDHASDRCGKLHFGNVALAMGFLSAEQLRAALVEQAREEAQGGPRRLIGELLRESGLLDAKQVEAVVGMLVEGGLGISTSRKRRGDTPPGEARGVRVEEFTM